MKLLKIISIVVIVTAVGAMLHFLLVSQGTLSSLFSDGKEFTDSRGFGTGDGTVIFGNVDDANSRLARTPRAGNTLAVPAKDVGDIYVKDFRDLAGELSEEIVVTGEHEGDFVLVYQPEFKTFILALLELPLKTVRLEAEKELVEILNINKEDACFLPLYVSTVWYVDEDLAGLDLGLSFCEGSTALF